MKKVIELKGIVKKFGSVFANDHIDFSLLEGEVHAILGENGAGKSSLMNVLAGVYQPDDGEIIINGERVTIPSPRHSIDMGIGMIHQHFKLVDNHTVLENMIAGIKGPFFINYQQLAKQIRELSERYALTIDPLAVISSLSVAEQQRVEILKVLYRGAKILILDEPTAVLTPQETNKLFEIINNLKAANHSIIFISHKLNEVLTISDHITVLRKGRNVSTLVNKNLSPRQLTNEMVGKAVELKIKRPQVNSNGTLLAVKNLTVRKLDGYESLKKLNFSLKHGEILGVAGVAGSGQKELCEAIAGLQALSEGEILYKGENIAGKSPRSIINMGISMSFVPEDRLGMGLVAGMDLVDNVLLKAYLKQPGIFVNRQESQEDAEKLVDKLDIDTPSVQTQVSKLSGGNIQKVLLGREIELQPELIITAYAARGLDVSSAHKIYELLNEQKERGNGIIFIGEDLDVLLEIADRIMVLCDGKITGIVNAPNATREDLGYLMAGQSLEGGHS